MEGRPVRHALVWPVLLVGIVLHGPRVRAEDAPAPAPLEVLEGRMDAAEAELTRLTGLTPTKPPGASADRIGALGGRLTAAEAIVTTLTGWRRDASDDGGSDRRRVVEARLQALESQLKGISGYTPPAVDPASNPSADPGPAPGATALDRLHELEAYCRWKEARAWIAQHRKENPSSPRPEVDAAEARVQEFQSDEHLGYAYLTSLTRSEDPRLVLWEVRFVTRPKVMGSCRVNFYTATDARMLRMTSRIYQDLLRGEHTLHFAWDKAKMSAEGTPVSARVELCYAEHAVDVLSLGTSIGSDWWKWKPVGSTVFYGQDAGQDPERRSFWIVRTLMETWSLDTVRHASERLDDRPARSWLEGTDVLPDEASAPPLPKPHAGYRSPVLSAAAAAASGPEASAAAPKAPATEAQVAALRSRIEAMDFDVAYGPDAATLERLGRLAQDAAALGVDDVATQATSLREEVGQAVKDGLRGAFRIKRLDIQKPTTDNDQHWVALLTFQVTRSVAFPFRLNFYTLLPGGEVRGSYVLATNVLFDSPSQEFAQVLALDAADVGTKPLKWRVEIGWGGVCCAQTETTGPAPKQWWLAALTQAHLAFTSRRRDAPGVFRVGEWGLIRETSVRDRLRVPTAGAK